jgi:hypothetical protein
MLDFEVQQERIKTAIKQFPETFGLRAFPNRTFKISNAASYVTNEGVVMLYTFVKEGEKWVTFCKATVEELKQQIVEVKE